uniref:Secreted protein n=1 Tax=Panagrolaimus davidi TaxID=227884 RepID=A0A914QUD2_9BILA
MRVLIAISFLLLTALIGGSYGGVEVFLNILCVQFYATPTGSTFDSPIAAMKDCVEGLTCIGFQKTSDNRYQQLRRLTGYAVNQTCKDYFLWDKTGGKTFPNQPNEVEAAILFAIFPYGECPTSFDVDGSYCRGRSSITKDSCDTFPSYMAARYDGTFCFVLQKQTIINSWT